jgi:hypothetical protein
VRLIAERVGAGEAAIRGDLDALTADTDTGQERVASRDLAAEIAQVTDHESLYRMVIRIADAHARSRITLADSRVLLEWCRELRQTLRARSKGSSRGKTASDENELSQGLKSAPERTAQESEGMGLFDP